MKMKVSIVRPLASDLSPIAKIWFIQPSQSLRKPEKVLLDHTFHAILSFSASGKPESVSYNTIVRYPADPQLLLSPEANRVYLGLSLYPWYKGLFVKSTDTENPFRLLQKSLAEFSDYSNFHAFARNVLEQYSSNPIDKISKELIESLIVNPNVDLNAVFNKFPFCSRRIEQILLSSSGTSARFLKKKLRFLNALKLIKAKPTFSLTEIAHHAGYYDQAHFIRIFREFIGQTPRAFLREQDHICWDLL